MWNTSAHVLKEENFLYLKESVYIHFTEDIDNITSFEAQLNLQDLCEN